MSIQIICVGTELLTGEILNTNFQFIAEQLSEHGLNVAAEACIHDTPEAVRATVAAGLDQHQLLITIGGLGPTKDDLTKESIAEVLGMPLMLDEELSQIIDAKFKRRNRCGLDAARAKQATVPEGAVVLPNDWGIAPGLWCEKNGKAVLMLPGPPREMQPIFTTFALERILDFVPPTVVRKSIAVFGVGESTIEQRVEKALAPFPNLEPAYCVKIGKCHVRVSAKLGFEEELGRGIQALQDEFGVHAGAVEDDLTTMICDLVRKRGGQWGTAESCTGGWIAKSVTDNAGVSDVFAGGAVTYSNAMKVSLLGVKEESLAAYGAVSEVVAREMVEGLTSRYGLLAGLAVTGIAGPTGGTKEKPVGTVCIATAVDGEICCTRHVFDMGRYGMRERTKSAALNQLRNQLLESC